MSGSRPDSVRPAVAFRATIGLLEELMENGLVVCGTPDMAVAQIKRAKAELGHGLMNLNVKIGNTPQSAGSSFRPPGRRSPD